jgi:hypothetical protein
LAAAAAVILFPAASEGYVLPPGRVRDPAGLQLFQRVIYNPILDDYLILYSDGRALAAHLSPAGVFSGETEISTDLGVTNVNAAFNPDDGTFLLAYRRGSPTEIYGRYLNSDGTPIGNAFLIGTGGEPHIAYSSVSHRYVVTWEQLSSGTLRYRVIDGDSTSPAPMITAGAAFSTGLTPGIAYGLIADKFLVTYVREAGMQKSNVYGRFISSNGLSVGPEFPIATGSYDQGTARVAYASSTNRWMVVWEGWSNCSAGCPHTRGALVSATGSVVKSFTVAATSGWDQPGQITYNSATDTFITGWRSAFSDSHIEGRAGEFSPLDGSLVHPTVLLSDLNIGVEGVAARPDALDPQALFLWRLNLGGDGVRASIMHLPPPIPDTFPPEDVTDLSGEPVPGGIPLPASAIASTSPGPSTTDMTKTTDGNPVTYWQAPMRAAITPEFITWDLGAAKTLSQVSLLARTAGNLFPVDYEIQVSNDNVNFTTVFSATAAAPAPGAWVNHPLPDPTGRYVRLWITKTKKNGSGKYTAQVAEVEIREANTGETLSLHWTAPGDDGASGLATSYDLRWSSSPINDGNFGSATPITTSHPLLSGDMESVTVAGFPSEDIVYFALKSRDEVPNVSGLSNVLQVTTPGVAPAPVLGLTASNPTGNSIDLRWQPSGDDGNTGNATAYDIRYSTSPINDANFNAAAFVLRPATNPKPTFETYTLGGLANQTTYYFAIKALDDVGLASAINGGSSVTATTLDVIAPSTISDLTLQTGGGTATKTNAPAIAASGEASASLGKAKATDANLASVWSTPGRVTQQNEFITLDAGIVRRISRVRLRSPATGAFFPEDLEIQLSNNNSTWITADGATGLPVTQGVWHDFDFGPTDARYVRVFITKTRKSGGGYYIARIAEIEVYELPLSHAVTLTWTEPGDDGAAGTPAFHDIRVSTSSIDDNTEFGAATQLVGEPLPRSAGSLASFTFDVPVEGIPLFFRMKAFDDAGNPSSLSNQQNTTTIIIPPGTVGDLLAFNATSVSADLSWTSTGDDGGAGTATQFDVRYSTSPITEGNFALATPATGEPAPAIGGTRQGMTISGLSSNTAYYFAMKVFDETLTASLLSNVATATTDAPDSTAPAAVANLAGSVPFTLDLISAPGIQASSVSPSAGFAQATDGNPSTYWASLGVVSPAIEWISLDTGSIHSIGEVRLLSRSTGALFPEDLEIQVSNDNVNFTTVATATGLPSTKGMLHSFSLPAPSGRYVRVYITKTRKSGGGFYIAQIAEIQVLEANFLAGPVTLHWTASGDDGVIGTATSYELRYSTSPITEANFGGASLVPGLPHPLSAGSSETFDVSLPSGTYYFAMRVKDEVPNASLISNVPVIFVP